MVHVNDPILFATDMAKSTKQATYKRCCSQVLKNLRILITWSKYERLRICLVLLSFILLLLLQPCFLLFFCYYYSKILAFRIFSVPNNLMAFFSGRDPIFGISPAKICKNNLAWSMVINAGSFNIQVSEKKWTKVKLKAVTQETKH